jgi:cytidine deaminase
VKLPINHIKKVVTMKLENQLYEAAINLIVTRYPSGWGGAAAMYTDRGSILTSVAPEVINASTELCIETGAICEAHKINERVTHTICVIRDNENSDFKVLTPCGICQERLFYWGGNVKAAIGIKDDEIIFKELDEIQPYHWHRKYRET